LVSSKSMSLYFSAISRIMY